MKYPYNIGVEERFTYLEIVNMTTKGLVLSLLIFYVINLVVTGALMKNEVISLGVFLLENILILIFLVYDTMYCRCSGFYLDEEGIYKQGIRKKRIDPKSIKGIKVTKYAETRYKNDLLGTEYITPVQDREGKAIYCMVLLNSVYSTMRTFNHEYLSFCGKFEGCVIGVTNYDLPAINRLRELNPDLVVMYEE